MLFLDFYVRKNLDHRYTDEPSNNMVACRFHTDKSLIDQTDRTILEKRNLQVVDFSFENRMYILYFVIW